MKRLARGYSLARYAHSKRQGNVREPVPTEKVPGHTDLALSDDFRDPVPHWRPMKCGSDVPGIARRYRRFRVRPLPCPPVLSGGKLHRGNVARMKSDHAYLGPYVDTLDPAMRLVIVWIWKVWARCYMRWPHVFGGIPNKVRNNRKENK